MWWAEQPSRAQSERAAISDLADQNVWLTNVAWRLADLQLVADFDLHVGEQIVSLILTYPEFYPDVAPSVVPKDRVRLSGHQYGAAGELCLQYRPDNWSPEITGAMMIESAYYLLSSEQETGEPAPSEHQIFPAQRARSAVFRFLYSRHVLAGLLRVEEGGVVDAEIQEHFFSGVFAAQLARIGLKDAAIWVEPDRRGYGASSITSRVIRLPEGTSVEYRTLDDLIALLKRYGFESLATELLQVSSLIGIIIFDGASLLVSEVYGDVGSRKLINYDLIFAEPDSVRLDPEYARLKAAKVAVVGCGSVGSKVAVQLARSGVGHFVLVDGDVLALGNLVRNELDWRAVGMHKSQALKARLQEVNADCEVISRTTVLGGQESGGATSATMKYIADCDLIIEATADPVVFNLCASIARRAEKPMCWAQVFGGGAGGIVVRLRPGIDPTPLTARQQIEAWYVEQGIVWPENGSSQPYSEVDSLGIPLIADDADVSVIAAHLSRFAIDLLARPDSTIFPFSAYLVGMTDRWLFTAPFDTRPIDLGASDGWDAEIQAGDLEALKQLVTDLFPGTSNAT
ncbi:ThiF family adenylyltransferase [Klebsiella oxytoca]|uniref:ThiF family adenylyltransferase n=1 Tax=Klebsiella oxytoca TaxID=571 RepID=UPI001B31C484|nr:ThiF family adenylyltransferase [Klebsiella oxytoca]EKQ7242189.1 ThiF family adenylyltransferase [Klebsiella oxytoca]WBD78737.1 ThiF family adenylyltransferase [Klebsiella oxytoca]HBC8619492.1 ThiF family adenylyltransferase [Klebsiella oxytoca]